jgi:hypothetical protein
MDKPLTLASESTETKPTETGRTWRERPITEDLIFRGTDDCGRSGWFLRLTVSGLYPRRVGPYRTRHQAIEVLEEFIARVETEPLCDLENDKTATQTYVIEGVPRLAAPRKTR